VVKRRRILDGLVAPVLMLSMSTVAQPAIPPSPGPASHCAGAAAERAALEAERSALKGAINDAALGRRRVKRKVSGGQVAAGVAGAAASVLLPFGVGALLGAGAKAAAGGPRKRRAAPEADVPAMIAREGEIDARLAQLGACGPTAGGE
jgi:hypothetical protein